MCVCKKYINTYSENTYCKKCILPKIDCKTYIANKDCTKISQKKYCKNIAKICCKKYNAKNIFQKLYSKKYIEKICCNKYMAKIRLPKRYSKTNIARNILQKK